MNIQTGTLIFIAGSPGSGKSNMIKYLMSQMYKSLHYGIIVCPTSYDGYSWLPQRWIHSTYNDSLIEGLMNIQESNKRNNTFIILDDCLGSINWNSNILQHFITTLRHMRITVMIATQYCSKIPTLFRETVNYGFIFSQNSEPAFKGTFSAFGQSHSRWDKWRDWLMQQLSGDRHACVIYERDSNSEDKKYRKFKAPDMSNSKFRIKSR